MKAKQDIYTFNETVIGSLHIDKEIPCEDSSASYVSDDGRIKIAVVADGHGAEQFIKSREGSQIATEITIKILKDFAINYLNSIEIKDNFYSEFLVNPRIKKQIIQQLTDSIISHWYDTVIEDYKKDSNSNPSIPEQEIPLLYGTTLIAAVMVSDFILLIQQGDGRCKVFYGDGTSNEPIKWDEKCIGNVTTSLCDIDAPQRIRSLVIDQNQVDIAAVFLGSDGIDDTYRDSDTTGEGTSVFYKYLILEFAKKGVYEFLEELPVFLEEFSKKGKFTNNFTGDDISVSGFLNLTKLLPYLEQFESDVKDYSLIEELTQLKNKLKGMTLKHNILKTRSQDCEEAYSAALKEQYDFEERIKSKEHTISDLIEILHETENKLKGFEEKSLEEDLILNLDDNYGILKSITEEIIRKNGPIYFGFKREKRDLERQIEKIKDNLNRCNDEFNKLNQGYIDKEKQLQELAQKLKESKLEYLQYHEDYLSLQERIEELKDKLSESGESVKL